MIEKLEIMMRSVSTGGSLGNEPVPYSLPNSHHGSMAEPSVSIIDVANKLNEVIDYLNIKERTK